MHVVISEVNSLLKSLYLNELFPRFKVMKFWDGHKLHAKTTVWCDIPVEYFNFCEFSLQQGQISFYKTLFGEPLFGEPLIGENICWVC